MYIEMNGGLFSLKWKAYLTLHGVSPILCVKYAFHNRLGVIGWKIELNGIGKNKD